MDVAPSGARQASDASLAGIVRHLSTPAPKPAIA
jgi:hypothetical protein